MNNILIFNDTNLTGGSVQNYNGYIGFPSSPVCSIGCNDVVDAAIDMNGDFFSIQVHYQDTDRLQKCAGPSYNPPLLFDVSLGYGYEECSCYTPPAIPLKTNRANALALNSTYLYTYGGRTIKVWNKITGALIATHVVNPSYSDGVLRTCEGIAVDECNNIYVGGMNNIHAFHFNGSSFSTLTNIPTSGAVYDLMLDEKNGLLYAVGNGFLGSYSVPTTVSFSLSMVPASCSLCNGSINITNTSTCTSTGYVFNINPGSITTTNTTINNLCPQLYTITANMGCWGTVWQDTITITSTNYTFSLNAVQTQSVLCYGGNNGSASVLVSGGVGGYTYTWSPVGGNNANATGLTAGIYTVQVSDANNCFMADTVQITQPPAISLTATQTQSIFCNGGNNGSANASASGGVGGYTYTWSPIGGNDANATGLTVGIHTVQVSDANNCTATATVQIIQPPPLSLSVIQTQSVSCNGGNNGSASALPSGGVGGYTYTWSPVGGNNSTATGLSAGIYTVQINDANNCGIVSNTIQIIEPPVLLATGMQTTICDGQTALIYPIITSPGNGGPYSYLWSTGATSSSINVTGDYLTQPNIYTVSISDGCPVNAVAEITVHVNPYPASTISFTAIPQQGCVPLTVAFEALGDTTISDYLWYFGNGESGHSQQTLVTYTQSGLYTPTLIVTNIYGCISTSIAQNYIEVYPRPIADFDVSTRTVSLLEPSVQFYNQSVGAISYTWNFGDYSNPNNISYNVNPVHEYLYAGTYTIMLIAQNNQGCEDYIFKSLYVEPEFHLYIPNIFTPDGNGLNDNFICKGIGIDTSSFEMMIFDRWGELIFKTTDFYTGWDGTVKGEKNKVTQDIYVYKIHVRDLKGNKHEFVGHVTCLPYIEE